LQTFDLSNQADGAALSVTGDGARLAYTRGIAYANLWRLTAGATPTRQQLTTGTASKSGVAVSPDGRWIAFVQGGPIGADLFKVPGEGGALQQLTRTGRVVAGFGGSNSVAWSADGTQLAFGVLAGGALRVATISADGGVARTFESTRLSGNANLAWAPGARILYHRQGNRNFDLLDPSTGDERPLVSNDSVGWMFSAQYSPEGDRVAVAWNRPPAGLSVWVVSLEDSSQVVVHKGWDLPIAWSRQGRSFYTVNPLEREPVIRLIPLSGGPPRLLVALPKPNSACALVGWSQPSSFVCMVPEYVSDVWIIEHFDPDIR
jgi:Tol biopolymer transport system component